MNCAVAYRLLDQLEREGWLVHVTAGLAGGVLVVAAHGNREIRESGTCVADVAGDVFRQARSWWRPDHAAPTPLPAAG